MKGSPVDPNRIYRLANQRLVRADHPALRRWRQNLDHARAPGSTKDPGWACQKGRATSSSTTPRLRPASRLPRISGTTARSIRGSSSASGIWSRRSPIPITVYAGIEDAAMFRIDRRRRDLAGIVRTARPWHRSEMAARRRRDVPAHHPARSAESASESSSPSPPRAHFAPTTAANTWKPINQRPALAVHARPQCRSRPLRSSHRACIRRRPDTLFMQKHWDVMRSDDAGDNWREVSGNLPTDFGFVDRRACARAGDDLRRADQERLANTIRPTASCASIAAAPAATSGRRSPTACPQSDCYVNVLRDAMAVDSLDKCGIYFGTTGGQVYASADAGDTWTPIVRDLPAVLSVEVQTLA